jgi:hypothetical protein
MSKTYLIAISLFLFCINISYSQVGIGTTNPTAKLEIDAASDAIPALEIVPRTTAPTGTASGQMSIIDGSLYIYDATRSKWLSSETVPFSFALSGGGINDQYLGYSGITSNLTGVKMPLNGTIVMITAESSGGNASKGFEIRKTIANTTIFSFSLASYTYTNTAVNINFNADEYVNIYANATANTQNPIVTIFVKWRK